jgi:nucleotide-binding universal stress UspA family protein
MVPVDGTHASIEAVALACDLARKNKGKVFVVNVIEVERTLPLEAQMESEETEGDAILALAEEAAKKAGYEVTGEILHAREAGPTIVDEAIERGIDLTILGTEYRHPFGQFELGKVIQYVLKNAPCEVWVCRHPTE